MRKLLPLVCFLSSHFCFSQSDSLSLVKAIERVQSIGTFPEALNEAGKIHKLVEASTCKTCKISSFMMMGKINWTDGRYKSSIDYFKTALRYLSPSDSLSVKSTAFSYIALSFFYQGYYDSALYYYDRSLKVLNAGNHRKKMPRILNQMPVLYH